MKEDSKKKDVLKAAIDKVVMVDAGIKNKYGGPIEVATEPKDKIYYPNLHLSGKEAPFLRGATVGDMKKLVIHAQVVSCNSRKDSNGNENHDYNLEIRKIGYLD